VVPAPTVAAIPLILGAWTTCIVMAVKARS